MFVIYALKIFYYYSTYCSQTTKETGFLQIRHSVISHSTEIVASMKFTRSSKKRYQHNVKILNWFMLGSCHLQDTQFADSFLLIAGNFKF